MTILFSVEFDFFSYLFEIKRILLSQISQIFLDNLLMSNIELACPISLFKTEYFLRKIKLRNVFIDRRIFVKVEITIVIDNIIVCLIADNSTVY